MMMAMMMRDAAAADDDHDHDHDKFYHRFFLMVEKVHYLFNKGHSDSGCATHQSSKTNEIFLIFR